MIIHDYGLIFIHIPKTAGVSITHSLLTKVLDYETTGLISHLDKNTKQRFFIDYNQKHRPAKDYVPSIVSEELRNKYYKFAVIRNPWDKVVSEYSWVQQLPIKQKPPKDFKEFLLYCKYLEYNKEEENLWFHVQPQTYFIDGLDDVFRFEELNKLEDRLSIQLQRHNTSNHKHYREYYNAETKELVKDIYRNDIEYGGYTF